RLFELLQEMPTEKSRRSRHERTHALPSVIPAHFGCRASGRFVGYWEDTAGGRIDRRRRAGEGAADRGGGSTRAADRMERRTRTALETSFVRSRQSGRSASVTEAAARRRGGGRSPRAGRDGAARALARLDRARSFR